MPGRPLTRQSYVIISDLTQTPEWWDGCLDRIACGDSPKEVAQEHCLLFGVFMRWVGDDEQRQREYDAALRIASEGHAHDCITIADEQNEVVKPGGGSYDPDVGRDKLRIETRLKLAGKWDRARYGETVKHEHSGALVAFDAGLIGVASALLAERRAVRVIDVTPEPVDELTRVIDVSREDEVAECTVASQHAVESPLQIESAAPQDYADTTDAPPIPSVPVRVAPPAPEGWL